MIVKDEIRCIDRCLETIVPHLDEVVIVDTGSTDGTLKRLFEWADAYPHVNIQQKAWTGHFAEMRNYAHSLVESDFIFIVDADEWLPMPNKGGEDPWKPIRRMLVQEGHRLDAAYIGLYNYLPGAQITTGDFSESLRIVHNNPKFRWFGTVHNQIQRSILQNPRNGKEPRIAHIEIVLEHDGYNLDTEPKIAKYRKRLPGLIQEINIQKERGADDLQAYFTFQLANGYYMCKDFNDSLATFAKLKWRHLASHNKFSAAILASSAAIVENDIEGMDRYTAMLMDLRPDQPISYLQRGVALMTMGNIEDAYIFVSTALALNEAPDTKHTHFLDYAYCNGILAEVLYRNTQPLEAIRAAKACLSSYPTHPRMKQILMESFAVISAGIEASKEMEAPKN